MQKKNFGVGKTSDFLDPFFGKNSELGSCCQPCLSRKKFQVDTLATRGLEEPFSSCAVVSVFVLVANRFWFYILLMYLEYHTVVVLC
jgi:hypothetical protein